VRRISEEDRGWDRPGVDRERPGSGGISGSAVAMLTAGRRICGIEWIGTSTRVQDFPAFSQIFSDSLGFLGILRDSSRFFEILLGFFRIFLCDIKGFFGILWDSVRFFCDIKDS